MSFTFTKRKLLIPALLVAGLAVNSIPAFAIFGLGDIVFDPSSFATLGRIFTSDASMLTKTVESYNQLIKIYSTGMSMYQNALFMKQRFSTGARAGWMTAVQQGVNVYTLNHGGETVLWPQVMNGAPSMAPQAWTNATVMMNAQPMNNHALGSPLAASVALVEMIDGASVQCMQNLGQYHQNSLNNAQPISFFHLKVNDDTDSAGSQIEQMILGNFASVQHNNEQRAQGTIQSCAATQQMLANKQMRDELVDSMNYNQHVQQVLNQQSWDASNPFGGQMP